MSKTRTITLTNQPPVTIHEDNWPIIASASDDWHDGQYDCQSNRWTKWFVGVRQHADGRCIVYAIYAHITSRSGERSYSARRGHLPQPGGDIVDAIRKVCSEISEAECYGDDSDRWPTLAADCIADLPAVALD
jgi:hypothetical protein